MTVPLDEGLNARVIGFIARQLGCKPEKVTPESRLLADLGLDGDDAVELFEAFAEEFAVDLSDFRCRNHFCPEGIPLSWGIFFWLLIAGPALVTAAFFPWRAAPWIVAIVAIFCYGYCCKRFWSRRSAPETVRVFHLVRAAATGRWVFP